MGSREIEAFLTHLAVNGQVAALTQNQAFNALLFLYREALKIQLVIQSMLFVLKDQNVCPPF